MIPPNRPQQNLRFRGISGAGKIASLSVPPINGAQGDTHNARSAEHTSKPLGCRCSAGRARHSRSDIRHVSLRINWLVNKYHQHHLLFSRFKLKLTKHFQVANSCRLILAQPQIKHNIAHQALVGEITPVAQVASALTAAQVILTQMQAG